MKLKVCHVFLLLLLALLFLPQAAGLEVTTSVIISGNGTVDHEAEANTEVGYSGIIYSEAFYTRSLGLHGLSEVNYTSDFDMVAVDRLNSTLNVDSAFELTEIKQMACLRNYNILSRQSFSTEGDTTAVMMFAADNCSSTFDLAQELSGVGGYKILVRNSTNRHVLEYLDTSEYEGGYELVIGSFIGCSSFPGARICDDWLACPGGQEWGDAVFEMP